MAKEYELEVSRTTDARRWDWTNIVFVSLAHALALFAVVYLVAIRFSWWTIALGWLWFGLCGLAITAGYHRLFAHPTYKARTILRILYLLFGAGSFQNSALRWSADHRRHHARTDSDDDPYNIERGFWWAHIGWVLSKDERRDLRAVRDLQTDVLLRFQDRQFVLLAALVGLVLPAALGLLWGDPIGALLVAGTLRLVLQWHATFAINSFAHKVGLQPFSKKSSARDSFWTALFTFGEGYHNFHHRFQLDYRNGVRLYHFDPTKWFIWLLSKIKVTWDLRRTPALLIQQTRAAVLATAPVRRRPPINQRDDG